MQVLFVAISAAVLFADVSSGEDLEAGFNASDYAAYNFFVEEDTYPYYCVTFPLS